MSLNAFKQNLPVAVEELLPYNPATFLGDCQQVEQNFTKVVAPRLAGLLPSHDLSQTFAYFTTEINKLVYELDELNDKLVGLQETQLALVTPEPESDLNQD